DAAMLVNIAWRWALVRLNLRPAFWWRMDLIPWKSEVWSLGRLCRLPGVVCGLRMVLAGILRRACRELRFVGGCCESRLSEEAAAYAAFAPPARRSAPGVHTPQPMPEGIGWGAGCSPKHAVRRDAGRRPVLELHAERKAALGEDFLDLGERLLAQVRGLEQLHFGLLDQVADVVDALGLEAVGRTHGQLQIVDRTQQDRVDARRRRLLAAAVAVREIAEHRQLVGEDVGGGAHGFLGVDRAVGLDVQDQLVEAGALFDAGGLDFIGHAAHGRERRVQHQPADRTGFLVRTTT